MHPELLKATVQACRDYIDAGDCHGAPPPVERLIDAVVQLADALPAFSVTKDWSERMAEREAGRGGPSAGAVNKDACPDCGQPWEDHEWGVPSPYCPSAVASGVMACPKCGDSGWVPNRDANGERAWTPLMNDALPCDCGALARKTAAGVTGTQGDKA